MPSIGDTVIFYTHEQMDSTHRTTDRVALVLAVTENYVDLKVFELGRAPYDERAYAYSGPEYDAAGNPIVGKSYWRDLDESTPDFESDFGEAVEPPSDLEETEGDGTETPTEVPSDKPSVLKPLVLS